MKRNRNFFLFLACITIFTGRVYAQDNNYIVSKYDFIPGEKVIFYDDFTAEAVGDFPAQWLTNGSGEIVTSGKFPGRWFNMTKMGYYIPEARETFTENFTLEFDFVPMNTANSETMFGLSFYLLTGSLSEPGGGGEPGDAGFQISLDYDNLGWKNWSLDTETRQQGNVNYPFRSNEKYHIAIWVQKQRVRLYANENKVLDVPRAIPTGSKPNIFRFDSRDEAIPLISNFRIAAGLPDLRNKLLNEGKIISYGIQFDVNSNKVKPESYSTLKEISDILKESPGLRINIVGHTDSDGDEVSNIDLSKRRSISVKNEFVNKFGIEAARLETDGKGESEPIEPNNSAVNKAINRRVEFINLKKEPGSTIATSGSAVNDKGSFTDPRDGKTYQTIKIGTQTWMAENLAWKAPAGCYAYDNNETNAKIYGYLYNWETSLKVCPSGWHLPSKSEWETLNTFLGGDSLAHNKLIEPGNKHWENPDPNVTNESGFTALPGGLFSASMIRPDIKFGYIRNYGYWWTSTKDTEPGSLNAWFRVLADYYKNEALDVATQTRGSSVRCIRE